MKASRTRMLWVIVAAIFTVPPLLHVLRHHAPPPIYTGEGFVAFRCAGAAVLQHEDPYLVEPLRSCEARAHVIPAGVVEPAPLPPATLAFFGLFAFLPDVLAAVLWTAILLGAYATTALVMIRLAPRVPPPTIWLCLAPSLVFLNGYYGETPTIAAAALALTGLALRQGRELLAAVAVTVATLFEPHVGGAAWLALLLFAPGARAALGLGVVISGTASVFLVGFDSAVSYLTQVLPAHAISELPANDQFSLTSLLYQLGWPAHPSLTAGIVSYAGALAVGCSFAPLLARRARAPEVLAFFPACAVLLGGTFIHDLQLALALPLAIVVANGAGRAWLRLAFATLLVGAIPEPQTSLLPLIAGTAAAFAAGWAVAIRAEGRTTPLYAGTIMTLAYVAFAMLVHVVGGFSEPAGQTFVPAASGALAEPSWMRYVVSISHPMTAGELIDKLTAYALLASALTLVGFGQRAVTPSGSKSALVGMPANPL